MKLKNCGCMYGSCVCDSEPVEVSLLRDISSMESRVDNVIRSKNNTIKSLRNNIEKLEKELISKNKKLIRLERKKCIHDWETKYYYTPNGNDYTYKVCSSCGKETESTMEA